MKPLQHAWALLQASGAGWDVETVLQRNHVETRAVWWRAGEPAADGSNTEAGFNLVIADVASGPELAPAIGVWLQGNIGLLDDVKTAGARGVLNVAVAVDEPRDVMPMVTLTASDLALLGQSGIELHFGGFRLGK